MNTRCLETDIHGCYSLVKSDFGPVCACKNNRRIWRHDISASGSRDVTGDLWWRHNATSDEAILGVHGVLSGGCTGRVMFGWVMSGNRYLVSLLPPWHILEAIVTYHPMQTHLRCTKNRTTESKGLSNTDYVFNICPIFSSSHALNEWLRHFISSKGCVLITSLMRQFVWWITHMRSSILHKYSHYENGSVNQSFYHRLTTPVQHKCSLNAGANSAYAN